MSNFMRLIHCTGKPIVGTLSTSNEEEMQKPRRPGPVTVIQCGSRERMAEKRLLPDSIY